MTVGAESCKTVFLGGTSYSLADTFAVGCIVQSQCSASQTDGQTDR